MFKSPPVHVAIFLRVELSANADVEGLLIGITRGI